MRTIYKYPIPVADEFTVEMPVGAKVLSVDVQQGPVMWAIVDPDAKTEPRRFRLYGTGQPCSSPPEAFLGTFLVRGETLVFHLFNA